MEYKDPDRYIPIIYLLYWQAQVQESPNQSEEKGSKPAATILCNGPKMIIKDPYPKDPSIQIFLHWALKSVLGSLGLQA